ncbi:hypothetical protein J1605_020290 [Eschrichtius robustus]|uniref:XLR/SYCP3/FAM9 domain-containing protein n=1 Tax=Eschrichtius robustus TaxID=9764 RepID=A0AB34HH14_ESCRO|nr:hypothetical protein J1605_020290 [Eschrichtius robustus]
MRKQWGGRAPLQDGQELSREEWGAMEAATALERSLDRTLLDLQAPDSASAGAQLCELLESRFLQEELIKKLLKKMGVHLTDLRSLAGPPGQTGRIAARKVLWVSALAGHAVRGSGAPGPLHACALLPANQRRSRARRGRFFCRANSDLLRRSVEAVKRSSLRRWGRKHRDMVPSGRKHTGKSGKTSMEDQVIRGYDFEKADKKRLSGSEEDVTEGKIPVLDKHGKKRTSAGIVEDMGGEVQNMLERFGVFIFNIADINKALLAKRKRLEMYTKASLKTSNQKIENVWKTQQEQRQKLNQEYSQQFLTLFQQWDIDVKKAEEQEEKLASMEDLEKNHDYLLTGAQNELRKEMAMLQKKIMMETQQQEMASVRKSLQSMLF